MGFFESYGEDYMASMNNAIGSATVLDGKYESLPDGKYQMGVYGVEVKPSNYVDGYPNFIMELRVVNGECAGRRAYKRYTLEPSKDAMDRLKTDLHLLGVELHSISDLENESIMSALLDQVVDVVVKNKQAKNGKTYPNYYLNRVVGMLTDGESPVDVEDTPWGK